MKQVLCVVAAQYDPAASDARRRCAGHRTDSARVFRRRAAHGAVEWWPAPFARVRCRCWRRGCRGILTRPGAPSLSLDGLLLAAAAGVEREEGTAAAPDEGEYAPRQYRYMSNIVRIARSIYSTRSYDLVSLSAAGRDQRAARQCACALCPTAERWRGG